jgi:glycosyltransferase involved in cell wall biosynthesis
MDLLIEATALVRDRGIRMITMIAGQGDDQERLANLVRRRGVADAVRFLGFVEDMPAFYSSLDLFALCSETESFGLALAEAMACERAVIATPTAGASRQIEHLHNGWQLTGFSAQELSDALTCLHRDPTARKWMGQQARETVIRQFSIELTLERTLRALRGPARRPSRLSWPGMNEPPFVHMATEDLA